MNVLPPKKTAFLKLDCIKTAPTPQLKRPYCFSSTPFITLNVVALKRSRRCVWTQTALRHVLDSTQAVCRRFSDSPFSLGNVAIRFYCANNKGEFSL